MGSRRRVNLEPRGGRLLRSFREGGGGSKSLSRRRSMKPSFDADNEFITLLHGSDPVKVELNRLENEVRDKDRELSEAQAEIKGLRLSERQREKAVEELIEELGKMSEKLKLTENLLESKNLEIKKISEEKRASMAAQFAAKPLLEGFMLLKKMMICLLLKPFWPL